MRTVVRIELMNIKMLKINKKNNIIVNNESDSQLDLKAEVIKFN